jgi:stage V sporulation protein SpoVS
MFKGNDTPDRSEGQRAALTAQELRVSARSNTKELAASMRKYLQNQQRVRLVAIGIPAINQALKAVCVLNGELAPQGDVYSVLPAMVDVEVCDETTGTYLGRTTTAMMLTLIHYLF